jgi:hypothetical protein
MYFPVSFRFKKSWYSQIIAALSHKSGFRCFTQSALGIIHSAETGPAPPQHTRSAGSLVARTCDDACFFAVSVGSGLLVRVVLDADVEFSNLDYLGLSS